MGMSALRMSQWTMNEIDSLNLNSGPALIAMNAWPQSVNETMSQSPDGVSWIVVTSVIDESGNTEQ
jgi:hypothetical protein